jgi:hypothetical protein
MIFYAQSVGHAAIPNDAFGKPKDDTETQLAMSNRGALRDRLQLPVVAGDLLLHRMEFSLLSFYVCAFVGGFELTPAGSTAMLGRA